MYKKALIFSLILFIGLTAQVLSVWPSENLEIVFCDVGQGDAILIKLGFFQALIDAGPDDSVLSCLRQEVPFWDRQLEIAIATHPDKDHIGGFEDVLTNYQIHQMFLADTGASETFKNMINAALEHQTSLEFKPAYLNRLIKFSSRGNLLFLAPEASRWNVQKYQNLISSETILSDEIVSFNFKEEEEEGDKNERSIIIFLKYFDFELLLMGDAAKSNELALIKKGLIKKVEGLKVGHHGSKTSTGIQLIQLSQPEFSVVSCGNNNQFGHPSPEVLDRLHQTRVPVFRTDELGKIKLITNGRCYWFAD